MSDTTIEQKIPTPGAGPAGEVDEISLVDAAATLWRRKWLVAGLTLAAAVFSVVYALLQPNKYTATSAVLPVTGSASSLLSQYAGLASLAGISLPAASSSDPTVKIQAILNSRGFAERLIEDMDLIPVLVKNPEKIQQGTPRGAALEAFREGVFSVSVDAKTSLIKLSAKTESPELSRDIANRALDLLQEDLQARTLSASGKNIVLLEQQVNEQELKVRAAQLRLTDYQRKNKLIAPQTQSSGSLQLYQALIQQKIALEIELSRLESALSSDNPKIVAAKTQLAAVKKQISDFEKTGGGVGPSMGEAPAALMEYANLSAELELATKLYGGLLASLENLRLQDATEKLFVEVIDRAVAPEKKSEPSRAMICVVGTLGGGFLAVLLAFILEALKKLAVDPEVRAKFAATKKKRIKR